jgi:DNA ligase-associated metallophosphoesterase
MTFESPPECAGTPAASTAMTAASSTAPLFDDLPGAPTAAAVDALATVIAGERVELLAERALHWPRERTLFVADVHLGKAATFRAHGVPIPGGVTATDLARLSRLIERTGAARIIVLGDLLHARAGRVPALDAAVVAWRRGHRDVRVILVRGNHDAHAGDPPPAWDIECVADPSAFAPFLACHEPVIPASGYALCGHVHPGVRLVGRGEETARLPCFVLGPRHAILPAFGRFTGLALVTPSAGARLVAIAGTTLFALPSPIA